MNDDMKLLGLQPEWAVSTDMWRDFMWGKRLTLVKHERNGCFENKW